MVNPAPGDVLRGGCWLLAGQHARQVQHCLKTGFNAKSVQQANMPCLSLNLSQQQPLVHASPLISQAMTGYRQQVVNSKQQVLSGSVQLLTPCCSAAAHNKEGAPQRPATSQSVPTTQPLQYSSMAGQVRSTGSEDGSVTGGAACQGCTIGEDDCTGSQDTSNTLVVSRSLLPGRYDLWAGRLAAGTDVELLMLQVRGRQAELGWAE
jgi:hypothetical protein